MGKFALRVRRVAPEPEQCISAAVQALNKELPGHGFVVMAVILDPDEPVNDSTPVKVHLASNLAQDAVRSLLRSMTSSVH